MYTNIVTLIKILTYLKFSFISIKGFYFYENKFKLELNFLTETVFIVGIYFLQKIEKKTKNNVVVNETKTNNK